MTTSAQRHNRFIYAFAEGHREWKDLLGGKGANLAEMTNIGLPVPPGFTITTEACRHYLETGHEPPQLWDELVEHLTALESRMHKRLGQADDPLLVSVRSGAKFSMPGMMETVLNVGLNDESVHGLAMRSGSERFAFDSYRRLLQMFGKTVLHVEGSLFDAAMADAKRRADVSHDLSLDAEHLARLVDEYKDIITQRTGQEFPQDPTTQLRMAIHAVFESWNSPRADSYRRQERIPSELGTAVNVCAMVFGNLDADSGTGVAFTRDPATGARGVYGDYLPNAQGEDVVAGIRNTLPLNDLERIDERCYGELLAIMETLESQYRDLCDIEFTIERGKLWMLQTRVGKRTAAAAFRIATQLVDEGVIDLDEAITRVTGTHLAQLMFPRFESSEERQRLTTGIAASPGAAVGKAVFSSTQAVQCAANGDDVILVRRETNPDDLDGMLAARGVLTSRGGKTSHAAVVARGMGKTCVCGADELTVDESSGQLTAKNGVVVNEGDTLSLDGSTGEVFVGTVPVAPSPVARYFAGELDLNEANDDLVTAVHRLMRHADHRRRLRVRTNADTPEDAVRARRMGAEGIGLCRTEHMFLGERRKAIEDVILTSVGINETADQEAALESLAPLQEADFVALLTAMDGLPVTIRLIDPPLHEFLPDLTELAVHVAIADERGEELTHTRQLLTAVRRLHERNPMLGLRGVRLGLVVPGLFAMQVRAIAEATVQRAKAGGDPRPEIMIPLVGAVQELELAKDQARAVLAEVSERTGVPLDLPVGTMIELPRAALTAGELAHAAEFFSFGTNDLTQTTWGFSRDDVEGSFFSAYLEKGVFGVSPFESIDAAGVGRLVRLAADEGRAQRPTLKLGVCGEHGGDPDSVQFFEHAGLDYVSCSPFRVPVARLEAARAVIRNGTVGEDR
ncbi:pyruvate, phosphate dikinase [Haloechinothrix salitolerans]|uniref:Pyruvate, phosphate dikinase n=1 Tax=Haloechinothrix salitolerans TaxID=926830 RepID=A0ABW2BV01_9PSEU